MTALTTSSFASTERQRWTGVNEAMVIKNNLSSSQGGNTVAKTLFLDRARCLGAPGGRTHPTWERAEQTLKHQHFQAGSEARVVAAAAAEGNQAGAGSRSSATGEVSKVAYSYFHLLQVESLPLVDDATLPPTFFHYSHSSFLYIYFLFLP